MSERPSEPGAALVTREQSGDELAMLRSLLLEPERAELDGLRERLENPELHAREVGQVLAEAIVLRAREDDELRRALQPIFVETMRAAVREDPQFIADAIYPVIGPAIRKAVASAFKAFAHTVNSTLNSALSLRGLKWRIEAWRTHRPFGEVVLRHTLSYQVEQVFLIHGASGLVVRHVTRPEVADEDPEVVGAMLSAIQEYTRDSFGAGLDETVSSLEIGELTVWIETGPQAALAAVVWGVAPSELRTTMQQVLERIHAAQSEQLAAFDGDTSAFADTSADLEDCLLSA